MTPDRWREIKQVFQAVVELPAAERDARLAAVDDDTRREVEQLLAAATTGAADFLEAPPLAIGDDRIGRRIGPWRIVEELGRGGMGAVYRASRADDELRGEVALKVVKRGMDTDAVLRRFRAERQILAGLSHPNIARLLDAGTTDDGTPWFAMELIHGQPIDRYCDRHQLAIRARLDLFATVCSAVQHAHQRLIVHRDLKPSNILVTDEGRPVLLDFGIAKLLAAEADATATGLGLMTPAYASPEQLAGRPVTTASDVYSLGVLAYELLAGRRPYDVTNPEAIVRLLERGEVIPPSAAIVRDGGDRRRARRLRGDLDAIVAMAMRPAPDQRYTSPHELANDLEAYLAGRPTVARREGLAGRTWKLVRRHRVAAFASLAVVVALVGGIVATTRQARIADAERGRAERRFGEVRQLAGRVLFELHDAIAELPGSTAARIRLAEESLSYLNALSVDATGRPDLLVEVSAAWLRVGDVQGSVAGANLGQRDAARTSYARALAAAEEARMIAPASVDARRAVAAARNRAGDVAWEDDDLPGSIVEYQRAIALLRDLLVDAPADGEARHLLVQTLVDLGDSLSRAEADRRRASYAEAQALAEALVAESPDPRVRRTLSLIYNRAGKAAETAGDPVTARARYQQALTLREEILAGAPTSAAARRDVSTSLGHLSRLARAAGDLDRARAASERALDIDRAIAAADPADVRAVRDLATSNTKLAEIDHESATAAGGDERVAYLRAAAAGFRRALAGWNDLEARGGFTPGDETFAAELHGAIATVDKDLAAEGWPRP